LPTPCTQSRGLASGVQKPEAAKERLLEKSNRQQGEGSVIWCVGDDFLGLHHLHFAVLGGEVARGFQTCGPVLDLENLIHETVFLELFAGWTVAVAKKC
jgi:hypothetical protein